MFSNKLFSLAALVSLVSAHSQILSVQGLDGSPASIGFAIDDIARNCTSISPCQQDATIIRDVEIQNGVAGECGRTEILGIVDASQETEQAIKSGDLTQVEAGTDVTMVIHQVNADGAGPYVCDLDPTGNLGATGQTPLTVTDNVPGANGFSQIKTTDFNVTITMPDDLSCTGGSTGDICIIRCRNNALAGPFGGCVAVQQVNGGGANNNANNNAANNNGNNNAANNANNNAANNNANNNAAGNANNNAAANANNNAAGKANNAANAGGNGRGFRGGNN